MYDSWHDTYLVARQVQLKVWQALIAQASGSGPGPSQAMIDEADVLQRAADLKLVAINCFVQKLLAGQTATPVN